MEHTMLRAEPHFQDKKIGIDGGAQYGWKNNWTCILFDVCWPIFNYFCL